MDADITYKTYSNIKDLGEIKDLIDMRNEVFTAEQGFPEALATDEYDSGATHFEILYKGKPAGCARIFEKEGRLLMGRFLITKPHRSLGLGKLLMQYLVQESKKTNFDVMHIYSQHQVVPFYERLGAKAISDTIIIADYPHVLMAYSLK